MRLSFTKSFFMKKIFLACVLWSFLGFAQKGERMFPVEYVLKSTNDTIKTKIRNTGYYSNKKYHFATIMFKMLMVDEKGNKNWVEPKDVKFIKITDPENITHTYYASSDKLGVERGLVEVLYEGNKISWYRGFSNSTLSISSQLKVFGYVLDSSRKIINIGLFDDSKKFIKNKIINTDPDLLAMWKSAKTDADFAKILEIYDRK